VQSHAMTAWNEDVPFFDLLAADRAVTESLPAEALRACFDPQFYLRHIDESFTRLGI